MKHDVVSDAQFFCQKLQTQAVVLSTLVLVMRMSGSDHKIEHFRMGADNFRERIDHIFDALAR